MQKVLDSSSRIPFFRRRFFLNLIWLLVLIAVSLIYDQVQLTFHFFIYMVPWYKSFLIAYFPFLVIQGIFHWFTLRHFFPNKRTGNIVWVSIMPILFTGCYWLVVGILFALALHSGALS
jgi:hypothetical protein